MSVNVHCTFIQFTSKEKNQTYISLAFKVEIWTLMMTGPVTHDGMRTWTYYTSVSIKRPCLEVLSFLQKEFMFMHRR